jgi:hypothetical protein
VVGIAAEGAADLERIEGRGRQHELACQRDAPRAVIAI